MKTTILLATGLFLSLIASAQEADVRSKTSTTASATGIKPGSSANTSLQNNTALKAEADPNPASQTVNTVGGQVNGKARSESTAAVKSAKSTVQVAGQASASTSASLKSDIQEINEDLPPGAIERRNNSAVSVSALQNNKMRSVASIKAGNNTSREASITSVAMKESVNAQANQMVVITQDAAVRTGQSVHTQSGSALSTGQKAATHVEAAAKKSIRNKTHTDASINTNLRPVPVNTSGRIITGAKIGL